MFYPAGTGRMRRKTRSSATQQTGLCLPNISIKVKEGKKKKTNNQDWSSGQTVKSTSLTGCNSSSKDSDTFASHDTGHAHGAQGFMQAKHPHIKKQTTLGLERWLGN